MYHACPKYLAAHFYGSAFPENGIAFHQGLDEVTFFCKVCMVFFIFLQFCFFGGRYNLFFFLKGFWVFDRRSHKLTQRKQMRNLGGTWL